MTCLLVISHRLTALCYSQSQKREARFRAAQEARKQLERKVKMEEYQEKRDLAQWFMAICGVYTIIMHMVHGGGTWYSW